MEDFSASRLREARVATGLNQLHFSERLGINMRTLRRYESGHGTPNARHLKRICEVTGKPLDFFFSSEGTPS
jgi:transcriptional regulator with XRE-family HTH domain